MTTVTLHDGRQVDSMGKDWQLECLARHLLARPLEERQAFLAGWEKRRAGSSTELRRVMTALHEKQRRERLRAPVAT
jgi:hypothetical protein